MLRPLSDKEIKEKEGYCYWWCQEYRQGEGASDNFCRLAKKDCPKKKTGGKLKNA